MVERVARALCRNYATAIQHAQGEAPYRLWQLDGYDSPEAYVEKNWRIWQGDARAALGALSEPTPGMLHAALKANRAAPVESALGTTHLLRVGSEFGAAGAVWSAMISAALEGEG